MKWKNFVYGLIILKGKPLRNSVKDFKISNNTLNNYLKCKTKPNQKLKIRLMDYSKKFNLSLSEISDFGKIAFFLNKDKNWSFFFKGLQITTGLTSRELAKKLKIGYSTLSQYKNAHQKPHNDYRILRNLIHSIKKDKLDISYIIHLAKLDWRKEIISLMDELHLTPYSLSKLFPTYAEQDIILWVRGTKKPYYSSLNRILKIRNMLNKNIEKRKILFYINKEAYLNNKRRLKIYLMRKYYLNIGQKEIENIFKRDITSVEAGTTPISNNKFQEFKNKFNPYFIKKYNKSSEEIEKEIENKIRLKQFNEIKQWESSISKEIINFDSKNITNQEKKVAKLFKNLGFTTFLHPILASEDIYFKKQVDCYATKGDMDILIECKDTNLNKFKDRSKKIITGLLTLKNKISPKLTILVTEGFTKQEYDLLLNNKILPITNNEIKIFSKNPDLLKNQINKFLKTQTIKNSFIPKTYILLEKWRDLNKLSRKNFTKLLKLHNIHIHNTQLYEREQTNKILPGHWIKCLISLEKIKNKKGLRYLYKLTKTNLPEEFDSIIGIKKEHPFGKDLEIKCRNYLRKKKYHIFSNVVITDRNLKYFPRGREIDIVGINKKGEKIIASCKTKHGSRQVTREVTDLNFLLDSLKEFDKAFLFTTKVQPFLAQRANDLNVQIIDTRQI